MQKRCMGCMEEYGIDYDICPHCGYIDGTSVEEQIHMEPGTILHNRYIVGKVLGFGGFGVTYLGWDGKLEMKVAIKEYLPSEFSTRMPGQTKVSVFKGERKEQFLEGLGKFVEEAKRLANFKNEDGIVRVFDSFTENETAYIIMEFLDGETLTELLKREGTIQEDKAVEILMPVMKSLEVVHKEGILHRDIAPDNIFITKSGDTKLIDFGASRYATTSHSRSLTVIIKPGYSPEEQYRSNGDQGTHTDVYALSATLYKMITGKTPPDAMERRAKFESQNKDILVEPRKINKDISQVRETAILNAMNVRVQDRTPDVKTFIDELESEYPAKRRYGKIKKIDVYSWPLWLKIAVPSALTVILVFGILLSTGVISFASLFSDDINVPEGSVVTPNVEGMSMDDAINQIESSDLYALIEGNIESEYIDANKIVLQSPSGGIYSKKGSTISLTVSRGNGEIVAPENGKSTVPYLIGFTESEAKAALEEAGLSVKISKSYADNIAKGLVISQNPEFERKVDEGTTVSIVISLGAKESISSSGINNTTSNFNSNKTNSNNSSSSTNSGASSSKINSNDSKTVTLTFDPTDGTVNKTSKTVIVGSTYGDLPTPTLEGHTFNGWFTARSGGDLITSSTKVTFTTNHTLYAEWTKNSWSNWVTSLPSDVSYSDYIIETRTEYAKKITTTSYETALSGYTQDGYSLVNNGSGHIDYVPSFPTGFNSSNSLYSQYNKTPKTNSETSTTVTKVTSTQTIGYIYWHWCRGGNHGAIDRQISGSKTNTFNTFHAVFRSTALTNPLYSDGYCYNWSNTSACNDTHWWFGGNQYSANQTEVKRCNYTTYKKLYNYYKYDTTNWSTTYSDGAKTRTVYRYKKR